MSPIFVGVPVETLWNSQTPPEASPILGRNQMSLLQVIYSIWLLTDYTEEGNMKSTKITITHLWNIIHTVRVDHCVMSSCPPKHQQSAHVDGKVTLAEPSIDLYYDLVAGT